MKKTNFIHTIYTLLAFAIPMTASNVINMVTSFVSMMMVAQLGKQPLAAGALAVMTYMTLMTITTTLFYAIGIRISHIKGQNRPSADIGLIVKNGFWLTCMIGLPASLLLWHADKLLLLFGQDKQLIALTHGYFHYAGLGVIPLLVGMVIFQFFIGTGRPKLTLLIAVINLPLTLFAAYCFIFGRFGMPMLGLGGITFAALLIQSLMVVCILFILYKRDKHYQLFSWPFVPDWKTCQSIITLGLPIGIQYGGEIGAMTAGTYLMGHFGVVALAASQVVRQYMMLIVMTSIGLTQALSILTSKAYGQHDFNQIKSVLLASMLILTCCFIFIGTLFCLFPERLIAFYVHETAIDSQLLYLGRWFFMISVVLLFVDGIRNLLAGALRGLHDSRAPMRIGIISLWLVSLPASYLVGFTLHGGPIGLRIGFTSGFILAAVLLWQRMQSKLSLIEATKPA